MKFLLLEKKMTKFTLIKILLVFLLGSVSANRLLSQELPKLKEGYIDINVLQAQVDQNTEDIRQIKSTLKLNASDQVKSPPKIGDGVFLGAPPAAFSQFGPWFWQPPTMNSTVSSPFTIDFPVTFHTQTISPLTTIVSESSPPNSNRNPKKWRRQTATEIEMLRIAILQTGC